MPGVLEWFQNPASQVSAHYIVCADGRIFQLVHEQDSAWHAGEVAPSSAFAGAPNPNLWTIGVEFERDVTNSLPLPPEQVAAAIPLLRDIIARHGPLSLILYTHDQFAVGRVCPGPDFPLQEIRDALTLPGAVTEVSFTATPQRTPLLFYAEPSLAHVLYTSSADLTTRLAFDGWSYGPGVLDLLTGGMDRRWYRRHNPAGAAGWCPSADLVGNAPDSAP